MENNKNTVLFQYTPYNEVNGLKIKRIRYGGDRIFIDTVSGIIIIPTELESDSITEEVVYTLLDQ